MKNGHIFSSQKKKMYLTHEPNGEIKTTSATSPKLGSNISTNKNSIFLEKKSAVK